MIKDRIDYSAKMASISLIGPIGLIGFVLIIIAPQSWVLLSSVNNFLFNVHCLWYECLFVGLKSEGKRNILWQWRELTTIANSRTAGTD